MISTHRAVLRSSSLLLTLLAVLAGCDSSPRPDEPTAPAAAPTAESGEPLSYEDLVALVGRPDPFERARALATRLPTLGPESVEAVQEVLGDAAVLELGAIDFELLMHYWAKHDPQGASTYALTTAPRGYRVAAIHAALTHFASLDPQQALLTAGVWTASRDDYGTAAQIALVRGWYQSGEPGLEDYIYDLGVGFERQRALKAFSAAKIRKEGPEALVRWAEAVPADDEAYKVELNRAVGAALVPFDLEVAKRFCEAHCEGEHGSNVRMGIATRWGRKQPEAALEWLSQAPEGYERDIAVRVTYAIWGEAQREQAVAWLERQIGEDGPPAWLEATVPIHANLLGKSQPEKGLAWADRIEDDRDREAVKMEIVREWRERDEPAAEAWMVKSDLSEETLEKIRTPGPQWRQRRR